MKYCQGVKCHTYQTKDRIRGTKGNKFYQTRRRSSFYYLGGNACSMICQDDWFRKFGEQAVNHFGRIHERIKLTEVNFVAELIKGKKRYFLANNNNLVPFAEYLTDKKLPNIYGKNAEFYFNDFQELLKLHDFNMDIISSYYFFQINRWDLVINNAKVIKFPSKALPEAIKVANKLLNNKDFNKYSVIDLRISNKIIAQ